MDSKRLLWCSEYEIIKGTVMQTEKALIYDRLRVLKVS